MKDLEKKVTDVRVVHKESKGSMIIEDAAGTKESILTNLPDVDKGHAGKILEIEGRRIFLRQPYE
jgi:hypothetical protein